MLYKHSVHFSQFIRCDGCTDLSVLVLSLLRIRYGGCDLGPSMLRFFLFFLIEIEVTWVIRKVLKTFTVVEILLNRLFSCLIQGRLVLF